MKDVLRKVFAASVRAWGAVTRVTFWARVLVAVLLAILGDWSIRGHPSPAQRLLAACRDAGGFALAVMVGGAVVLFLVGLLWWLVLGFCQHPPERWRRVWPWRKQIPLALISTALALGLFTDNAQGANTVSSQLTPEQEAAALAAVAAGAGPGDTIYLPTPNGPRAASLIGIEVLFGAVILMLVFTKVVMVIVCWIKDIFWPEEMKTDPIVLPTVHPIPGTNGLGPIAIQSALFPGPKESGVLSLESGVFSASVRVPAPGENAEVHPLVTWPEFQPLESLGLTNSMRAGVPNYSSEGSQSGPGWITQDAAGEFWAAPPGFTNLVTAVVETITDLKCAAWSPLLTLHLPAGAFLVFNDVTGLSPAKFYRLRFCN